GWWHAVFSGCCWLKRNAGQSWPAQSYPSIRESPMNSTTTQQQRAQLGTGASLAWTERPGDGHVVMLVHGYPLDRRMWTRQMNALEGHRIIAPDLRGSGESHPVGQPVTLGQHAD